MTDQFKELLNAILSQNPTLPVDELLSLVEKKKEESHGLLSDEGAIRLLAQQLSVDATPSQSLGDLRIASLQAGLMDASIGGTVLSIGSLSEFMRQDGSAGKVLRIGLADASGRVTCVAWDEVADFVAGSRLATGFKLRLEHGYTKYGRAGEIEFHLGSKSNIQVLSGSSALNGQTGPVKVSNLSTVTGSLSTVRVRMRKLQNSRSEKGPVQALCEDETGLVIVKFWDETGDAASAIGEGKTMLLEKPYAAERNGVVYLNVGRASSVIQSEVSTGPPPAVPIGSLSLDPVLRMIAGKIVERTDVKEIETREGRKARVSNIRIEDTTGTIRVSLWDKHAEFVDTVRPGDLVELVGVKIRRGFMDQLEASTMFLSQISKK